nr:hypothetical protein HK105_002975 [Polyrhizophydium stewartii]
MISGIAHPAAMLSVPYGASGISPALAGGVGGFGSPAIGGFGGIGGIGGVHPVARQMAAAQQHQATQHPLTTMAALGGGLGGIGGFGIGGMGPVGGMGGVRGFGAVGDVGDLLEVAKDLLVDRTRDTFQFNVIHDLIDARTHGRQTDRVLAAAAQGVPVGMQQLVQALVADRQLDDAADCVIRTAANDAKYNRRADEILSNLLSGNPHVRRTDEAIKNTKDDAYDALLDQMALAVVAAAMQANPWIGRQKATEQLIAAREIMTPGVLASGAGAAAGLGGVAESPALQLLHTLAPVVLSLRASGLGNANIIEHLVHGCMSPTGMCPVVPGIGGIGSGMGGILGGFGVPAVGMGGLLGGLGVPAMGSIGGFGVPAMGSIGGFGVPAMGSIGGFGVPAMGSIGGFGVPAMGSIGGFGMPAMGGMLGHQGINALVGMHGGLGGAWAC